MPDALLLLKGYFGRRSNCLCKIINAKGVLTILFGLLNFMSPENFFLVGITLRAL
jgi:hypothetical protein